MNDREKMNFVEMLRRAKEKRERNGKGITFSIHLTFDQKFFEIRADSSRYTGEIAFANHCTIAVPQGTSLPGEEWKNVVLQIFRKTLLPMMKGEGWTFFSEEPAEGYAHVCNASYQCLKWRINPPSS